MPGMKSAFFTEENKGKIKRDFEIVRQWAERADTGSYHVDIGAIGAAATRLSMIATHHQSAVSAIRGDPELVRQIDEMSGPLVRELKARAGDDADRTNPALRTALRRIGEMRAQDIWHIQLT